MPSFAAYISTVRQYRFLWLVLLLQMGALLVVAAVLPFETRTINNVNLWLKPVKFLLSTSLYAFTIPFYMQLAGYSSKKKHLFAVIVAATMLLENVAITGQASRGVMSHFNITSHFNARVFIAMGIAIVINTVLLAVMTVDFFRLKKQAYHSMIVACRYALVLILLASVGGGIMSGMLHHSIGAADNMPGMPLTNWNRMGGDLRVMHFFGIHAMQLLPFIVWYGGKNVTLRTVHFYGMAISGLVIFTFIQALRGEAFAARKSALSVFFFQNKKQFTSLPGTNGIITSFHFLDGKMLVKK